MSNLDRSILPLPLEEALALRESSRLDVLLSTYLNRTFSQGPVSSGSLSNLISATLYMYLLAAKSSLNTSHSLVEKIVFSFEYPNYRIQAMMRDA